jgi:hypothetical protein
MPFVSWGIGRFFLTMDKDIKQFLEAEMTDFGVEFIAQRRNFLSRKISASGDLSQSLGFEIDKQVRSEAVMMLLAFEEYGRLIDMKRLKAVIPSGSDNEYVSLIEAWIKDRNWEQKFINGYMRRSGLKIIPPSVLHRIAWGIVISRAKRVRPKKWWNKSKTVGISDLFNRVVAGLPDKTSDILKGAFAPN